MRAALTLWLVLGLLAGPPAGAAPFTVDDLGDAPDAAAGDAVCDATGAPACTLRAAIQEANALPGNDSVNFGVAGTLIPASPYTVTSNITISGATAPGFQNGTPSVVIQATGVVDACLDLVSGVATVRGLHVLGGCTRGIRGGPAAAVTIAGNVIGVRPDGSGAQPLGTGIEVVGPSAVIGGPAIADRNVISGATGAGIAIAGSGAQVRNNRIGTNAAGTAAVPNGTGIVVDAGFASIGQSSVSGSGNLISGNLGDGIHVASGSAFVQRNTIGFGSSGGVVLGNGGDGVEGAPGSEVAVGGGGLSGGNVIGGSGGYGVRIHAGNVEGNCIGANGTQTLAAPNSLGSVLKLGNGTVASNVFLNDPEGVAVIGAGTRVPVFNNSFRLGGLGIDLGDDGRTPNDPGDADGGPNGLQNFPVITGLAVSADTTKVTGTITAPPNSSGVEIEILADGALAGPPVSVDVPASGEAPFEATIARALADGTKVTAGATSADGSSELAETVTVGQPIAVAPPPAAGGPDLAVDLQGPAAARPGQELDFAVVVSNVGTARSGAARVRVEKPGATEADRATYFWFVPDPAVGPLGTVSPDYKPAPPNPDAPVRGLCGRGASHFECDVPAMSPGRSVTVQFTAGQRTGVEEVVYGFFFGALGARTLTARLAPPLDTTDPPAGANRDELTTTFTLGSTGNDSDVRCPARRARASARARACTVPARSLRVLSGRASGDVARVEVAVLRATGGARAAAPRCRWLGARGRLVTGPVTKRRCDRAVFLTATGTRRWRLKLRRRLPRGSYVVYSRAVNRARAPESGFSARDGNRLALKLR